MGDPIEAIAFYAVFVFSVTIHEASHAWAAMLGGDLTAYEGGQVSIDPLPHMKREPFGMVILPLLSVFSTGWPIGYASAPYNVAWAERYPTRAGLMALAGPGANLAMAVLVWLIVRFGLGSEIFEAPDFIGFSSMTRAMGDSNSLAAAAAFMLSILFSMNLLLFVLNMLPLPPLDGAAALVLVLPESMLDGYRTLTQHPVFAIIGLLLVWNLVGEIFRPVLMGAIELLYPGLRYG